MENESQIINVNNPKANMYGCLPCPECNSEFRWPTQSVHPENPDSIICDDCGFIEKWAELNLN